MKYIVEPQMEYQYGYCFRGGGRPPHGGRPPGPPPGPPPCNHCTKCMHCTGNR
ncbi:MAG: hypothetical protein IJC97_00990 [Oscillospiraceae bacterium]|nr:hypothetical protein [Oscillospiraceae bacterium]